MSNVLQKICDTKRGEIAQRKHVRSEAQLLSDVKLAPATRPFAGALRAKVEQTAVGLIAEIKRASPSRGIIRAQFDPPSLAVAYEAAGAACLSVLTDAQYFQGDDRFLTAARLATQLPVLRKDFMLDTYQIAESRLIGADCILLIMAALTDVQAAELEAAAMEYGMDVLIEVHDKLELMRALKTLKSPLIGINNRNLKTLEVDLRTCETLAPLVPEDKITICESGIATHQDVARLQSHGVHCFLVGESLMQQDDVRLATQKLLGIR